MNQAPSIREPLFCVLGVMALMLIAHLFFGGFFPSPAGVGHDYAGGLPGLLAEYYWSLREGPFAAPWFTPAFCGGIPIFADPGSMYYAFPSIFVRFLGLDPLGAIYVTFLLFTGIGFLGAYSFCRVGVRLSWQASTLAAVLFGLNGFYVHRMLVGHIGFHGVMLIPWLAYVIATGPSRASWLQHDNLLRWIGGGVILAYWVHAGAQSLIPAFGLASGALIVLAWLRGAPVPAAILRGVLSVGLGIALAASKLVAMFAYMGQFPRSGYRLPGFASLLDSINIAVLAVFANLSDIADFAGLRLENSQWRLDRQEYEYGVSLIPAVLLVVGAGLWLSRRGALAPVAISSDGADRKKIVLRWILGSILLLPILLNTYAPWWNDILKSLPLVGSSSSMLRWFVIYVPVSIIAAALVIDWISDHPDVRSRFMVVGLIAFVWLTASVDRQYYRAQNYDPAPVTNAFRSAAEQPDFQPRIESIGAFVNDEGAIVMPMNRNDTLIVGSSQLACYMPIFGYRLENFPFKTLRLGSIYAESAGVLNLKNPACFVFPNENNCAAGDHFPLARKGDAERFASYRRFDFNKSSAQKVAEWVTGLALLILLVGSGIGLVQWIKTVSKSTAA